MATAATATVHDLNAKRAEKEQTATFDLDAVLKGAKKTETSKSKSKIPVIPTPEPIKKQCSRIADLVGILDSTKAEKDVLEAEVIAWAAAEREKLIARQGFIGSVKVEGINSLITLSWEDKYRKLDANAMPDIQEILGDRTKDYFAVQNTITVKKDCSEAELRELVSLVGVDKFYAFFSVSQEVKTFTRYTQEKFTAFTAEERERLDQIVKQYKPAVKTK